MGGFFSNLGKMFTGSPAKRKNVSTLRSEQEPLYEQLTQAGMGEGAGGAFGNAADYYRNLLSDDSQDVQAFTNPAMRQYFENIAPQISEQFAGMGSGGLSSSGFRNAQVQGGVDLAERLGQIRANLRNQGAQGLANIGGLGLGNFSQNMETEAATPGLLSQLAPAVGSGLASFGGQQGMFGGGQQGGQGGGFWSSLLPLAGTAIGGAVGGPAGAMIGGGIGGAAQNWGGSSGNKSGANTSGYQQNNIAASPQIPKASGKMNMPQFMQRQ